MTRAPDTLARPAEWAANAVCAQQPYAGGDLWYADEWDQGTRGTAISLCRTCPVLDARTGQTADITEAPAGVRFAAQFSTAWANGQQDTAYALFRALVEPEDEQAAADLAEGIRALFDMAVVSLNEMTGRTA